MNTSREQFDVLRQDGTYPRPQLVRSSWHELDGAWEFARDTDERYSLGTVVFDETITVPYPPESPASGIGETGFLRRVWYRRKVTDADLRAAGLDDRHPRPLLHFGAVDHEATVWINGQLSARHSGGQTPFTVDLSGALAAGGDIEIVVCASDPPDDVSILRGKQDWREHPHSIWYHRTTGIWQPVWVECVPAVSITDVAWGSDVGTGHVDATITIDGTPPPDSWLRVELCHDGALLAESIVRCMSGSVQRIELVLNRQLNGQEYEELLWSPLHPTLISATVSLEDGSGEVRDHVGSYLGLRSVATEGAHFLVNDRPTKIRAVLAQNYWPQTHLAAPADALRHEVELIVDLGFNAARIHQKAEDPRFLFWADRLGLMIWAETASAYAFDDRAIMNLTAEWTDLVRRDRSHPCIVAWVPLNESWGVQHIAHDPRQQALSRAITDLTRALDGTRPVISNDGWEHTSSDIWTIHDYEGDSRELAARYSDRESFDTMLNEFGPAGRRLLLGAAGDRKPVMITEFGGVSLASTNESDWGYSTATDVEDFAARVCALIAALESSRAIAGYCYTQLTDTGQETNGILRADRTPKFPVDKLRSALSSAAGG